MSEDYDYLFKCVVVGDGGVGKTALTIRFSKGYFTEDYKMTIGVDFHVKTIGIDTVDGPIQTKLQIWDTGGQERFSSIRPMYYRGSLGALIIFDLTSYESFQHLPQWLEEIRANIKNEIPLLLVGNKSDLVEHRAVSVDEINSYTRKFNLYYMETSAKTGEGVGDCFYILACLMIGAGVPDQLISSGIVFSPDHISVKSVTAKPELAFNLEALKVQEPPPMKIIEPEPHLEPEPDVSFEAPQVPEPPPMRIFEPEPHLEPEPEVSFEAPPVPEPPPMKIDEPELHFKPEPEVSFEAPPVPEPPPMKASTEEQVNLSPIPDAPSFPDSKAYKPKAVPFSSNIPVPAPTPEDFQESQELDTTKRSSESTTPFILPKHSPALESKPTSIPFESSSISTSTSPPEGINNVRPFSPSTSSSSDEIIDYTTKTLKSKKDKKKKTKKKKKVKEQTEKVKKEKKSKVKESFPFQTATPTSSTSSTPSLFQALSKKTEVSTPIKSTAFTSFTPGEKEVSKEPSDLRIIPKVEDIESKSSSFTTEPQSPSIFYQDQPSSKQDLMVCSHCGATLSKDYLFCNKCGNRI